MHEDMQRYYSRNKLFLSQIGIWPYQPKIMKILLPCLLIIIQISFLIPQIFQLYDNWGDINITIEVTIVIILITGAAIKLINIRVNNNKLRHLLQLMNDHWRFFRSQCELQILRDYADIGRKVTKYYAVYIYTFVILRMMTPLIPRILDVIRPLNESRPLKYLIKAEYRMDKEKYYYPILLHGYVCLLTHMIIMVTIDTMYVTCVLHCCSLFTAIGLRLKNVINKTNAELDSGKRTNSRRHNDLRIKQHNSIRHTEDYSEMIVCLKKHQLALEYVHLLDSTFTYATFFLLFLNIAIMSLIGVQFVNNLGHIEIMRCIIIILGSFTHLLCICFPGQLLIDRSAQVFDRAYSSQWYTFSPKTKKLLRMLLCRSLVPCTLSAGKIYTASMATYSLVIQTAISYFTAFLSMR